MAAYDAGQWTDLFVAAAGAGAALAGLVFVAVSINIERILQFKGLPERALETVLTLLGVVIVAIIGLIPGQSSVALGAELLIASLPLTILIARLSRASIDDENEPRQWLIVRIAIRGAATLPFVIGAVSLLLEAGGGLYWIVAGIVFAIGGGVANAWVLLVEILR